MFLLNLPFSWNTALTYNGCIFIPLAGIFLMYSFGALLLEGWWQGFFAGIGIFAISIILQIIFGVMDR